VDLFLATNQVIWLTRLQGALYEIGVTITNKSSIKISGVGSPDSYAYVLNYPINFSSGDVNLYRYAGNDPVNLTDPFGLYDLNGVENYLDPFGAYNLELLEAFQGITSFNPFELTSLGKVNEWDSLSAMQQTLIIDQILEIDLPPIRTQELVELSHSYLQVLDEQEIKLLDGTTRVFTPAYGAVSY
jgi:hypothetical protein